MHIRILRLLWLFDHRTLHKSLSMKISMIAAATLNHIIGKDGDMPWHLPADLKYFKRITLHHHVIMGRKTFEAFGGGKPLPKRTNIVLTRQEGVKYEGVQVAQSVEKALELARKAGETEAFLIGGEQIYRLGMEVADRIYLTRIYTELEGDTFFPIIDEADWQLVSEERYCADEKHAYDMSFRVWERKLRKG